MNDLLDSLRRCSDTELRTLSDLVWSARESAEAPRGVFAVLIGLLMALKAEQSRRSAGAAFLDSSPEALSWVAGWLGIERDQHRPIEPIYTVLHEAAVVCHETVDLLADVQ